MKNNRLLNFLLNVLQVFMQMCVAVCAVNLILHGFLGYETFQARNTLYIGVVVFVFYLAKTCVKNGKLSFLIHLAAVVSIFFVVEGPYENQILVLVPALVFFSASMKRKTEHPVAALDMGILVGCYIVGSSIKAESATVIPFYCSVIYIIAFFIWYNIKNLNSFVQKNGSAKSFNVEQAVNVNSVMLALFMGICAIVMFIMPRLHIQDAIRAVFLGIWGIVLKIIHALNPNLPTGDYELEQMMNNKPNDSGMDDLGIVLEMSEGNDILDLIMVIFAAIIFICMMVLVLKSLKDVRYKKSQGNDVKEFVKPEFKHNKEKKKEKKFVFHGNVSNDVAVRKLYKNLIRQKLKKGHKVDNTDTPQEISKSVIGWDNTAVEVTNIYEKARYSEEMIAKEDVETLRKARKNLN